VLLPGDRAKTVREQRSREGIPLTVATWAAVREELVRAQEMQ
jgi:LDH2 family malate/lactate/ureidoglycolate dehydrogenase